MDMHCDSIKCIQTINNLKPNKLFIGLFKNNKIESQYTKS